MPAFLFLSFNSFASDTRTAFNKALQLNLDSNPKWLSLLHIKNDQPQITDSRFILSDDNFSPAKELEKTLEFFFEAPDVAKCRFPARYMFLDHYLDLQNYGVLPAEDCPELTRYKKYVPYDQLNLIFASEVLASASSMMGHSFLNATGKNFNNTEVSHSISFFTEFDSFNPAVLIYDGLVAGMKGLFIVRPFEKDLNRYSQSEGRNVWSFSLDINDFDRDLIKLHIWELKDVEIEYLFQSYNCATLTLYILSIANPELIKEDILFVSPLDVAKAASKYGMIKDIGVELSDDWALKMLEQEIDRKVGKNIEDMVFKNENVQLDHLDQNSRRFAVEYLSRLIENEKVKSNLSEKRLLELTELADANLDSSVDFDLSEFKNPLKTPQDSLFAVSYVQNSDDKAIDLTILPASKYLYGDNRQYFSESELKIGELSVRVDTDSANTKLQSLTLYAFKTLAPSSDILPKYSGSFYLGYRQLLDKDLHENGYLNLSGGIGKSKRFHKDILLFAHVDFGMAAKPSNTYFYAEPAVGAIINLIADSKVMLEYKMTTEQNDLQTSIQALKTQYSWYGQDNWTLQLSHTYLKTSSTKDNEILFSVARHF